jgi:hypothetical protein
MNPFYYIYHPQAVYNEPKVKYKTLADAKIAAERLALKHPDDTFEILMCVAISRCPKNITFFLEGIDPETQDQ